MKRKVITAICLTLLINSLSTFAQVIISKPIAPTPSDSVVITFNAALGSKGLKGYTGDVYAHTGVITSESSGWTHVQSDWGVNIPKCKLNRIGNDLYEFKIAPSIKQFYEVGSNEKVIKLAFVFRDATGTNTGKTDAQGDIFFDVATEKTLHLDIIQPKKKFIFIEKDRKIQINANAGLADSIVIMTDGVTTKVSRDTTILDSIMANNYGTHWIKLAAFTKSVSVSDSFGYFVCNKNIVQALPGAMHDGVNYLNNYTSNASVLLCLVAPNKTNAFVVGEFNNWKLDTAYQMKQTPDKSRFWIEIFGLTPGKEYAYKFNVDGITVADPFTHKILDPDNDKFISSETYLNLKAYPIDKTKGIVSILQTNQPVYNWKHNNDPVPSKDKLVIYELLVRDFVAKHDYKTIIDSLKYLKRLNINAIELMPVMEFEGNSSWGYNPSFYFAPDKYYGPANDLKKFVDTCHSLGIAVIFDMVLNHSFGQSPMVQLYWDNANNMPSSDNPWFNQTPKHDYNVGFDFNHESAYTKLFVSQVLKYWLTEFKADGFRFDLSKGFTQKNTLGDVAAWGNYDATRVAIWKAISDTIWKVNKNAYVILEHFADNSEEKELVSYGMLVWGNMNYNYNEATMGWNEADKTNFSRVSYKVREMSNPGLVSYMESHDEERIMYKNITYGNNGNAIYPINGNLENSLLRTELGVAFFLTVPGPKMIWQFGELGYDINIDYNGRTGEKPIHWEYYSNPSRKRLFTVYNELLKLRNDNKAFSSSDFTINAVASVKTIAINDASMDVRIIGNFDIVSKSADPSFSKTGWWYNFVSGDSINVTDVHKLFDLAAGEYKIFTSKRLAKPSFDEKQKINHIGLSNKFSFYPNPCNDQLKLEISDPLKGQTIFEISDVTGKTVLSIKIAAGQNEITIQTNNLKSGIYLVGLKGESKEKLLKLE
jgi:pullulanase/glycogen debranching enzyme